MAACDALALNLLAGAVIGGLGLAAAAWATGQADAGSGGWARWRRPGRWRSDRLPGAGPALPEGPVRRRRSRDPRLLARPRERGEALAEPLQDQPQRRHPLGRLRASWASAPGSPSRRSTGGGCAIRPGCSPAWPWPWAIAAAWAAVRMDSYVEWFAIPPVALLAAELGKRMPRYGWLSTALCRRGPVARRGAGAGPDHARASCPRRPPPQARRPPKPRARPRAPSPPGPLLRHHHTPLLAAAGRADGERDRPRPLRPGQHPQLHADGALSPHELGHPERPRASWPPTPTTPAPRAPRPPPGR